MDARRAVKVAARETAFPRPTQRFNTANFFRRSSRALSVRFEKTLPSCHEAARRIGELYDIGRVARSEPQYVHMSAVQPAVTGIENLRSQLEDNLVRRPQKRETAETTRHARSMGNGVI